MNNWPNPFIEQRADPFILRHEDHYYFIASVPEYDRLEIRRADTLAGLAQALASGKHARLYQALADALAMPDGPARLDESWLRQALPQLRAEQPGWLIKYAGFDQGNQAWGGRR